MGSNRVLAGLNQVLIWFNSALMGLICFLWETCFLIGFVRFNRVLMEFNRVRHKILTGFNGVLNRSNNHYGFIGFNQILMVFNKVLTMFHNVVIRFNEF